tara:strand:- start:6730 stop:7377 length:648 start_codon:yes stop_codon:yes gene_type:complete
LTKFTLTIKSNGSNGSDVIEVELNEQDENKFTEYLKNLEALNSTTIVKNSINTKLKINFVEGKGLSCISTVPSDDEISTFLHKMRMFVLNKEFASYNSITGIIKRQIEDDRVRSFVKSQRAIYDGKSMNQMLSIKTNNGHIISDSALFDWMNGYEYHSDLEKREKIDEMFKKLGGLDFARGVYLSMLTEKAKAISSIGDFVKMIMNKNHTIEINV